MGRVGGGFIRTAGCADADADAVSLHTIVFTPPWSLRITEEEFALV